MSTATEVNPRLKRLTEAGVSVWLDQIRRSLIESVLAGPAMVVTENEPGAATATVAVAVLAPTFGPVTKSDAARPCASVTADAGDTVPPPAVTANETTAPRCGLPLPSMTRTRMESPTGLPAATDDGRVPTERTVTVGPFKSPPPPPQADSVTPNRTTKGRERGGVNGGCSRRRRKMRVGTNNGQRRSSPLTSVCT